MIRLYVLNPLETHICVWALTLNVTTNMPPHFPQQIHQTTTKFSHHFKIIKYIGQKSNIFSEAPFWPCKKSNWFRHINIFALLCPAFLVAISAWFLYGCMSTIFCALLLWIDYVQIFFGNPISVFEGTSSSLYPPLFPPFSTNTNPVFLKFQNNIN